jgi:hypothetical protein
MRTNLKRLEEIISDIKTLNGEAAEIIEANSNLYKIMEEETSGAFLSICCICDEAQAAVDIYRKVRP